MTINLSWRLVAFGLICALLGGALAAFQALSWLCFFASGLLILASLIVWIKKQREDRYSLSALQQVHDRAEAAALEVDEAPSDMVFCMCCNAAYPAEFPTCPACANKRK